MKLANKILLKTTLIWLVFALTILIIFHEKMTTNDMILFVTLTVLFWGLSFYLSKILISNRIHSLLKKIKLHKFFNTPSKSSDEIDLLTAYVNELYVLLLASEEKLTNRWTEPKHAFDIVKKQLPLENEHIIKLAYYDKLTSLPNRIFFNEMLNKSLNHAKRHQKKIALLFIDLDKFKNINDALGYQTGDKVLKDIADRFTSVLRSGDIIARLGGDEFVILLNDINHPKTASSIADKILQVTSEPIKMGQQDYQITASIGICIFPHDGNSLEILQKNADLALYKAKCAGGGVYQYFTNEMTLEAHKHIKLHKALQKAIANNEFVLHYQPKFSLSKGNIIGVEALVRWVNPEIGLINPVDFIPHAEETGFIMGIGEWVLREACRVNKGWQNQGYQPISIAVNLSAQQFNNPKLVSLIETILAETKMDPHLLELEITESSIMENIEITIDKIKAIKRLGIKICIDDFGTGYTSINLLKKFMIDCIKIDQSFVKDIPYNQNDNAITSAIIALGRNLEIQVVAEGVETHEQLQFLTDHHCDLVQGYYFSRPLPESKMILQLSKG